VNALEQGRVRVQPDPATWRRPEMVAALAARDVSAVFRLLRRVGMSQQRIAALTGQSQPEVSAIMHGRKVMSYSVLLRVADGLGIPRGLAGLASCSCQDTPAGHHTARTVAAEHDGGDAGGGVGAAGSDGGVVGELAVQTVTGLERVAVGSVQPLPDTAMRRYLEEGRTIAVVGLVDLARSRLPGLDAAGCGGLGILAEAPSIAQITGEDRTPPPVVLLAGATAGGPSA
jgi:hypothetical protein